MAKFIVDMPESAPRAKDPHHGGVNEFCYHDRRFWVRQGTSQKWYESKRSHLTPARIIMFYGLLVESDYDHTDHIDEIRRSHG